jgi:hypothetical protein
VIGDNDKELNRLRAVRPKNWGCFRTETLFFFCMTCSSAVGPTLARVQWVRAVLLGSKSAGTCY